MPLPDFVATVPIVCLSCDQPLTLPRPKFCPACGQDTHIRPPRIGEFIQQLGGAHLATQGALWRTLKLLLFKPGELTRQYRAGRRKHFVLALRLYLTVSVIALLLLRMCGSPMEVGVKGQPTTARADVEVRSKPNIAIMGLSDTGFGLKDGVVYCRQMPTGCASARRSVSTSTSRRWPVSWNA